MLYSGSVSLHFYTIWYVNRECYTLYLSLCTDRSLSFPITCSFYVCPFLKWATQGCKKNFSLLTISYHSVQTQRNIHRSQNINTWQSQTINTKQGCRTPMMLLYVQVQQCINRLRLCTKYLFCCLSYHYGCFAFLWPPGENVVMSRWLGVPRWWHDNEISACLHVPWIQLVSNCSDVLGLAINWCTTNKAFSLVSHERAPGSSMVLCYCVCWDVSADLINSACDRGL